MPKIVRAIEATGTPLVRLSPGRRNGKQLAVSTNDREISAEMTRYLASLGHRKIAFIQGHPSHKAVANRYLGYSDEPLVSIDYQGNQHSSIVDGDSTKVIGTMVKILSWYDNEWGYSNRVLDLIQLMEDQKMI